MCVCECADAGEMPESTITGGKSGIVVDIVSHMYGSLCVEDVLVVFGLRVNRESSL